jgi:hypothetical protein
MEFLAELKQTKQTKSTSQDNVYSLTFATDDCRIMDIGKLPSDTLFVVKVEVDK